jgi:MFS family permease
MRQVKPARFNSLPPIVGFSLVIFFITLADGVMSFMAPIAIEDHLRDPALVGIVLSISSFLGIALDLYVADRLAHKSFRFFITRAFLFAALFPVAFLVFPSKFVFFCLAMLAWSVYYEFIGYSKYNFVHKFVQLKDHTNAWATLVTFSSMAYMIGPGIAVLLIHKFANLPFYAAIVLVGLSSLIYFFLEKSSGKRREERALPLNDRKNLLLEFGVLKTLMKKLWILVFFIMVVTLMDVLMWTVGVLYTAELGRISELGEWLLVIYGLPALFIGLLAEKLKFEMGKKRMAFTSAAIAGLCLIFTGINGNIYSTMVFVFLMSVFFGITIILIDSTFQDYVARAGVVGNDIVSLFQFAHNVSYSFGPIILGVAAKFFGYARTFQLVGVLVLAVAVLSFLITPRKIKMPQKEIKREILEIEELEKRMIKV